MHSTTTVLTVPSQVLKSTPAPIQEQTADDLALDEVESNFSIDEDAVPARKVVVNNKVRYPL
jgi:hypothetical protein